MSYIAPPALDRGDKIAVVSLASRLDAKRYYAGKEVLQKQTGFEIIEGKNIFAEHYNFAGTDEQRIRDFQEFLDDPSIKAIIAGRGGYGISRIVDRFSWDGFIKNPKWVVGFSDVTLLHQKLQTLGFQSIHGPMMVTLPNEAQSTESLINSLTGEKINYRERSHILNRTGNAEGEIIGGNLCLLAHNIGSSTDYSWDNKILFLEDVGEYLYNIDRMMLQLKRSGKLHKLRGLIVGQFSDSKENSYTFGKDANEIIAEHTAEFSFPVCFDFPIGHETENRAIRCGENMQLNVHTDHVNLQSKINHELHQLL